MKKESVKNILNLKFMIIILAILLFSLTFVHASETKKTFESDSEKNILYALGKVLSFNWLFNAIIPAANTPCIQQSDCGDTGYCDSSGKCVNFLGYHETCDINSKNIDGYSVNPCLTCLSCIQNPNGVSWCSDSSDSRCSEGSNTGICDGGDCQLCGTPQKLNNILCTNPCYDKIGNLKSKCTPSCYETPGNCKTSWIQLGDLVSTWCDYLQMPDGTECVTSDGITKGFCNKGYCDVKCCTQDTTFDCNVQTNDASLCDGLGSSYTITEPFAWFN